MWGIKKRLADTICAYLIASVGVTNAHAADSSDVVVPSNAASRAQPTPRVFSRSLAGTFNGVRIKYVATAGATFINSERGEVAASMFAVQYVRQPTEPHRPVIFLFNGGSGTASLFLHIGAFGPKCALVPSDARQAGNPAFTVVDNIDTLLDLADFEHVWIVPSTGVGFCRTGFL